MVYVCVCCGVCVVPISNLLFVQVTPREVAGRGRRTELPIKSEESVQCTALSCAHIIYILVYSNREIHALRRSMQVRIDTNTHIKKICVAVLFGMNKKQTDDGGCMLYFKPPLVGCEGKNTTNFVLHIIIVVFSYHLLVVVLCVNAAALVYYSTRRIK